MVDKAQTADNKKNEEKNGKLNNSAESGQFKKRLAEFIDNWQKKFAYLSDCLSRSGMEGVSHWLKSHHQIDALEDAVNELNNVSKSEDFQLLQVETTLSCFLLPEEDLGQADWYKVAHQYLLEFETELKENNRFDIKKIQSALKELRFISQADEFHQRYGIQSIQ